LGWRKRIQTAPRLEPPSLSPTAVEVADRGRSEAQKAAVVEHPFKPTRGLIFCSN
jgi:hypothetical protein